ncbi:MAG: cysteine--tRNA ligase [Burkholderiaceae bacterium]
MPEVLQKIRPLKIYNSLTRSKEPLVPIEPGHVRLYVCGLTVYDFCHIGHARVLVVFDMVRRWLEASGYRVTYVRNITDIDDKIIRRAGENNEPIGALTQRMVEATNEDAQALGVLPPHHEPRATQFVPEMLELIQRLQVNGHAYQDADGSGQPGDVHFSVRSFPGYGKLSGKSVDELRAGERVAVTDGKRDPLDFVLWKRAKPEEPKEAVWSSPYGLGRPGWHIECSAMSCSLLGKHFDIHGGGADLQFPHHENEIAQSEGAYSKETGKPFVNLWMHNGFVNIDDEKMSKSLGNFFTVRDVLAHVDAEVVRFFILKTQYRSPINYSDAALQEARAGLHRLYTALQLAGVSSELEEGSQQKQDLINKALASGHPQVLAFRLAMQDDFNTPEAIAALFGIASELNRQADAALGELLRGLAAVLGLLLRAPEVAKKAAGRQAMQGLSDEVIEQKVQQRLEAKKAKDFTRADAIRDELTNQGVIVEDGPQGSRWRRA